MSPASGGGTYQVLTSSSLPPALLTYPPSLLAARPKGKEAGTRYLLAPYISPIYSKVGYLAHAAKLGLNFQATAGPASSLTLDKVRLPCHYEECNV